MSQRTQPETDTNELRPEYDFSAGVRGKHHRDYQRGQRVTLSVGLAKTVEYYRQLLATLSFRH